MPSTTGKLAGKVSGGTDGIGLPMVKPFVAEGARHVYITGRRRALID
jgi:NAD(P)-dependent dehydrogenase (short-subunit alcohol dehydrogenase family)